MQVKCWKVKTIGQDSLVLDALYFSFISKNN
jgi:hypothetical protein